MNPIGPDIPLGTIIIVVAIGIILLVIQLLFSVFTSILYFVGNIIGLTFKKIREFFLWLGLGSQQSSNLILIIAAIVNIGVCVWIIIASN